jgi:hypothetical protein
MAQSALMAQSKRLGPRRRPPELSESSESPAQRGIITLFWDLKSKETYVSGDYERGEDRNGAKA